jgi:acetyltransferase-like isoleucine patch superfamily enzyme
LPVLDKADAFERYPDAALVPDNEYPKHSPLPPGRLVSLVDPSCCVNPGARIGLGCVLYPRCFVGCNARLGDRVFALSGSVINHDDVLEDGVCLCSNATLAGGVTVGRDAYLGQACTVRQFTRIGARSLVGMGAVVIADVAPDTVVAGNPARPLRHVRPAR